jgi:Vacuolar protein sorting 55
MFSLHVHDRGNLTHRVDVALTFVLAPIPNSLCGRLGGVDDLSADYSRCAAVHVSEALASCLCLIFVCVLHSAPVDLGHFLTAVTIVSGLALPLVLSHAEVIHPAACWMSIAGGGLVYGTITIYAHFFSRETESF